MTQYRLWSIYIRANNVYIPTVGVAPSGLWKQTDDVAIVPCDDIEGIAQAIEDALEAKLVEVPDEWRGGAPFREWILPKLANVRSQAAFERGCRLLYIQRMVSEYRIEEPSHRKGGGWEGAGPVLNSFPLDTPLRVIAEAAASHCINN